MAINEYEDMLKNPGEVSTGNNEYYDLVNEQAGEGQAALKQSMYVATKQNPDQEAKVQNLSKKMNLPADFVRRKYDDLEKKQTEADNDYETILKDSPTLSKYLEDPNNASVSHDDLDPLGRVDRHARAINPNRQTNFIGDLGRATKTGWNDLNASAWHLAVAYGKASPEEAAQSIADANKRAADLRAKAPDYSKEFDQVMKSQGDDVDAAFNQLRGSFDSARDGKILEALKDFGSGGIKTVGETLDMIGSAVVRPRGLVYSASQSLAHSLPSLVTGYAGSKAGAVAGATIAAVAGQAGPQIATPEEIVTVPAGAVLGGTIGFMAGSFAGAVPTEVGSWINQTLTEKGYDVTNAEDLKRAFANPELMADARAQAERKGLTTAGVDAVFNAFAGKFVPKAGSSIARKVVGVGTDLGVQMVGEGASELAGQVAAKEGFEGVNVGESVLEGISSLGHSMGETVIMSPVKAREMFSKNTVKAAQEVTSHAQNAMQSQADAQALMALGDAVKESKTQARLPEKIKALVEMASQGGEMSQVYFQANDWDSYWNSKGLSPAKAAADIMGDDGKAYYQSKTENTSIAVSMGDYVSKVASSEHFEGLLPSARTREDGMTLKEANEFLVQLPQVMQTLSQEAQNPVQAEEDPSVQVKANVKDQLLKAGFDDKTSDNYAQIYESAFKSLGQRTGQDPVALFNEYGLSITRPDVMTNEQGETAFNQSAYFKETKADQRKEFVDFLKAKGKVVTKDQLIFPHMLKEAGASEDMIERLKEFNDPKNAPVQFARVFREPGARVYNQNTTVPNEMGFYSKLGKIVDEKMGGSATVEQINGMLKEIKPEERKWSGLDDFLKGKEKVSKADLQAFLQGNQLEIKEVTKGGETQTEKEAVERKITKKEAKDLLANGELVFGRIGDSTGRSAIVDESELKKAKDLVTYDSGKDVQVEKNPTKFEKYTLPGGENYKELLFTMPNQRTDIKELPNDVEVVALEKGDPRRPPARSGNPQSKPLFAVVDKKTGEIMSKRAGTWDSTEKAKLNYLDFLNGNDEIGKVYKSSHYGERNILAHTRINERVDADGKKVLFIEEVQSDWHQEGRKKGYKGDVQGDLEAKRLALVDRYEALAKENNVSTKIGEAARDSTLWQELKNQEMKDIVKEYDTVHSAQTSSVPDAPFKKTWHEFVLKRLIRMAAEQGFDKIAWTTGEQQADRYSLEKKISMIRFAKSTGSLMAFDKNENVVLDEKNVTEDQLESFIGKEAATKLMEKPMGDGIASKNMYKLEGQELKMGGEGMKGFYDKMIPQFMEKFGKKYEAKVGTTKLGEDGGREFIGDPVSVETLKEYRSDTKLSHNETVELSKVIEAMRTGSDFTEAMSAHSSSSLAKFLGGEIRVSTDATVHSMDITPKLREAALNEGFSLFQKDENDPRGQIRFGKDAINIELLKKADLSTFIHETGHFYLEVLGDIASKEDAPQAVKDDFSQVLKWLGVESVSDIKTEHHEQFARGFEAYLMEGKAPSVALRDAFTKFKAWLVSIYKKMANLNVELTPEVRGVFDRLLATEEEIAEAQAAQNMVPLFADPKAFGMNEVEAAKYAAAINEARVSAEEELQQKLMKEVQRERTSQWKEERTKVKEEVTKEVHADKLVVAMSVLQKGTMPDGTDVPEGLKDLKFNKQDLIDTYGEDFLKKLPKPFMYATEDGLHPNLVAEMFGYGSGDELIQSLVGAKKPESVIEARTTAIMKDRHGDLLNDPELPAQAMKAVHNEKRAQLLRKELEYLASNELATVKGLVKKITRPIPMIEAVRDQAEKVIAEKAVRDIKPSAYQRAEVKASREAIEAFLKGDFEGAFNAKQRELYNHELYRAATSAKEEVDKTVDFMKRFQKLETRKKLGKAGQEYLDQVDSIMERFDFTRGISLSQVDKRKTLVEWIEQQREMGFEPVIPAKILQEAYKKSYKDMSFEELQGVRDAVKNISKLAKLKNELLKNERIRDLQRAEDEATASIAANAKTQKTKKIETRRPEDELYRLGAGFFAEHRKLSNIAREMDGWQDNGVMWDLIVRPLNEAANVEANMIEKATIRLDEIYKEAYTRKERLKFGDKTFVEGIKTDRFDGNISKEAQLAVAMNWGNLDNRQKLMEGYNWTEAQVQQILDLLDERDWKFVQNMWNFIDSYWADTKALNERTTGIAPEKVEAAPVKTKFGEFTGGYFPLKYDDRQAPKAFAHRAQEMAEMAMHGASVRATTKHGHREARVQGVKMPVRLDLGVGFEHVTSVVHDLSHYETLIDTNRILGSKKIQSAIIDHYGDIIYGQMRDALLDIAAGNMPAADATEKAMNRIRTGLSISTMGWNLMTSIQQPLGLTQSIFRVGPKYVAKGLSRWIGDAFRMENTVKVVHEKSDFMRLRHKTQIREINEIRNTLRTSEVMGDIQDSFLYLISKGQMIADVPTWLGAYEKAMDQIKNDQDISQEDLEKTAVALADQAVIDSQGGGQIKDLAKIQRKGPIWKLWTSFYSYFSATYNLNYEAFKRTNFNKPASIGRLAVDVMILNTLPATLSTLMAMALKGSAPEDEDEFVKQLAAANASYLLGNMIFVRELGSAVQGFQGYQGPAGARFFSEVGNLYKQANQGEFDESLLRSLNKTAGILFQYPAGQVDRTVRGFNALHNGETSNPAALLFGPAPKR